MGHGHYFPSDLYASDGIDVTPLLVFQIGVALFAAGIILLIASIREGW